MRSSRYWNYFLCLAFQSHFFAVISNDCLGLQCLNGGTGTQQGLSCRCACLPGFAGLVCQYELKTSTWPKGPYHLIMPKDGCPESKAAGWEIGYINFTTRVPFELNDLYNNGYQTNILGPFGHHTLQINFCFKSGDHALNLPSKWPNWKFEIFRADEGCPAGFEENNFTASLPSLLHWNVDGSVPSVLVNESFVDNRTYVSFPLCTRIPVTNKVSVSLESEAFILLKDPNTQCKRSGLGRRYNFIEERFLVQIKGWYNKSTSQQELKVCYYRKGKANLALYTKDRCETTNKSIPLHQKDEHQYGKDDYTIIFTHEQNDTVVWAGTSTTSYSKCSISDYTIIFTHEQNDTVVWASTSTTSYNYTIVFTHEQNDTVVWASTSTTSYNYEYSYYGGRNGGDRGSGGDYMLPDDGNIYFLTVYSIINCAFTDDYQGTWLMIDARESIILESIYIRMQNVKEFLKDTRADHEMTVYIDKLRWGYLQNGAHVCESVEEIEQNQVYFRCTRKNEGRYVTLLAKGRGMTLLRAVQVSGYSIPSMIYIYSAVSDNSTEIDEHQLYTPCNKDLGMKDHFIQDFQLKASSKQKDYPAYSARPGLQGWCASIDDTNPYIQVDCLSLTLIDGISITNWHEEIVTQNNDDRYIQIVKRGARSFSIEYGISERDMMKYSEKSFSIDTSLPLNEPQVFIFYRPFITRYVRIFPTALYSQTCLKFELFGCKSTGQPTIYCKNDGTEELVDNVPTLITSTDAAMIYSNVTLTECRNSCLRNQYICNILEYYSDNTCKIFTFYEYQAMKGGEVKKSWKMNSASVQEKVYSGVSVCWKDEFETFITRVDGWYFFLRKETVLQLRPNLQEVISRSDGAPYHPNRETETCYMWIIEGFRNIKLLFMKLDFQEAVGCQDTEHCYGDALLVSTDRFHAIQSPYVFIHGRHDEKIRSVRTDKQKVYLYFMTSSDISLVQEHIKRGFMAIFYEEEIAECGLYINEPEHTSFMCNAVDIMRFASHTFWEMTEITTTFTSYTHRNVNRFKKIRLQIESFDVSCLSASKFTLMGHNSDNNICNKYRPAANIVLLDYMIIQFTYAITNVLHPIEAFSIKVHTEDFNSVIVKTITSHLQEGYNYGKSKICKKKFHKCYNLHSVLTGITWMEAAKYCETKDMYLLSIKNRQEMDFIRQVLQVFSVFRANNRDFLPTRERNGAGILFTHIGPENITTLNPSTGRLFTAATQALKDCCCEGLFRYRNSENVINERWADGSPPTFNAWSWKDAVYHLSEECSVMDFLNMSVANPWQRRPCTFIADYFVCEKKTVHSTFISDKRRFAKHDNKGIRHILFQCSDNEWTSVTSRCNGIVDCSNSVDERGCIDTGSCEGLRFRCDNGECVQTSKVCNFIRDCEDGSDEYCEYPECIPGIEAKCDNLQCIPEYQLCDAVEHCLDGSDEKDCVECNVTTSFACLDRRCIPIELKCDGHSDCTNAEDEDCFRAYSSCDDVLMDGFRESGYYSTLNNEWFECDFNFETSAVTMTWRNGDWYPIEGVTNRYGMISAGYELASIGYSCTQKITQRMSYHQEQNLAKWNPMNISVTIHEETLNYSEKLQHLNFKGFQLLSAELFMLVEIFGQKKFGPHDYVISMGPLICTKDMVKITTRASVIPVPGFISSKVSSTDYWSYLTPCGINSLPVYIQTPCIYDTDDSGVVYGCKSFEHLTGCESVECGPDYFKCPGSYCVPYSLVCDGIVHCPIGEDENNIDCQFHSTVDRTFIFYAGTSKGLADAANTLGTQLLTKTNPVFILHHEKTGQTPYIIRMYNITSVTQLKSRVSSKHRVTLDNPYSDVIRLFSIRPQQTSLFISLQEQAVTKSNEKMLSLITSALDLTFTYKVELNQGRRTRIRRWPESNLNYTHITINSWKVLRTAGFLFFPEAFNVPNKAAIARNSCENGYRCPFSRICIPLQQVCDGRKHCPYGQDELLCDFKCPANCTCVEYNAVCRNYSGNVFLHLPPSVRVLDASYSYGFNGIIDVRSGFPYLLRFNATYSGIAKIANDSFLYTKNLLILDLSFNRFTVFYKNMFEELQFLRVLFLKGNEFISRIDAGAYNNLKIKHLEIKNTRLTSIVQASFVGLNLTTLNLAENNVKVVDDYAFDRLTVQKLDISSNPIQSFGKAMFTGVKDLQQLKTPAYKFCCVRPVYLDERNCYPQKDEFSSCADLMRRTSLQFLLWIVGALAVFGNILSMIYRILYDRKRLNIGYGIFVTNLAVADFLMGVYMIIIAVADQVFRNRYIEEDERWRSSFWCSLAGVLSTISSESSVFFICLITLDRILVIKYPFGTVRITPKIAHVASLFCWLGSFMIAMVPVVANSYFKNQFYSKTAVCLALPLTKDRPAGWLYSIVIFIGFNFITFVLIAIGQMLIYFDIKKHSSAMKHKSSARRNDLKVARNLLLLVTSDFACWFPIGCMGIMALSGHVIPGDVYAWTAVLVLPVNSAINPFLYTLSAIVSKKKFTPSTEEQEREQITKREGKAMLRAYRFSINASDMDETDSFTIDDISTDSKRNLKEKLLIFMHLLKCTICHHKNQLVFQKSGFDSVVIHMSKTDQVCKKVWIQLLEMPVIANNKKQRMNDVYEIGKILENLIKQKQDEKTQKSPN